MDREHARHVVAGVVFALAGGAAASFLAVRGMALLLGLPAEAAASDAGLARLGYGVWAVVALILSAAWMWRIRSR